MAFCHDGDCIMRGRDLWNGGAMYHSVTVEAMAFGNTGDAFTAIDRLVFREGRYTISVLLEAAKRNYEKYGALLVALRRCPKYGQSDRNADGNTRRGLEMLSAFRLNQYCMSGSQALDLHIGANLLSTVGSVKR